MKVLVTCMLMGLLMSIADDVAAETELTVTGQVRARMEYDDKSFRSVAKPQSFTDLRTRLGVRAVVDSNTVAFVQLQDSRRLGGRDAFGDKTSGTLTNGLNVDVHQAYVQINHLWNNGPGVKAGRFEVNLANQRVFGSVGWNNIGRSWEGVTAWFERGGSRIEGYGLKAREDDNAFGNTDFDIYGLTMLLAEYHVQGFAFYEYDASSIEGVNALDRVSAGVYYLRTSGAFDVELTGVYQFGNQRAVVGSEVVDRDVSAFLLAGEFGFTANARTKPRLAIGADYTSGDDNPSDNTQNAYDNLYYTGHAFRGYMDYFVAYSPLGLMDLMVRGAIHPTAGWSIKADLHYFQTAVDYVDVRNKTTRDLGTEVDITVSTTRVAGVTITGGGSVFFPSESYGGFVDPRTTYWGYMMLTADF